MFEKNGKILFTIIITLIFIDLGEFQSSVVKDEYYYTFLIN